jgi:deoxyribonuclease-2
MNISALDESGKAVDWWFIYKVPELTKGANNDQATGYEYVYFDPTSSAVEKSHYVINEGKGALNQTLDSVFKTSDKTTGWILYNDEMPANADKGRDNGNLGHTKGVIAFDTASKTAYWLLHSWPKFSDPEATQDPTPKYGQTYLCISLDIATAGKIATQMANHQEPQTYLCNTANLAHTDPLYKLSQPLTPNPPALDDTIDLKSRGGMPFKVIAKNREWNQDFWNDLVGPTLGDDMDVETWIRGPIPPIADRDGIHKTFDIKFINLGPLGAHWAWPETHDHAKWGITKNTDWICVGDINRMISQRKRGGGTIAFQNKILWHALSKTDLILAPPGHSRTEALGIIQTSQQSEEPPKTTKTTHVKLAPAKSPPPPKHKAAAKPKLAPKKKTKKK